MSELTQNGVPSTDGASAKDKAADVADTGKQAAGEVADTAKDAAKDVAAQTKKQASDLVGTTRRQLTEQAEVQQNSLVGTLRDLGDQLAAMTDDVETSGTAVDLAAKARDRARSTADWLDKHSPADVVDELRKTGRERPGAFLLGSLVAGLVAGRLTRGVVDVHTDGGDAAPASDTGTDTDTDTGTAPAPVVPVGSQATGRHEAPLRVSGNGSAAL